MLSSIHKGVKMSKEEYIEERIKDQINFFDKKSPLMKRHYYVFAFLATVGAILTPVIVNIEEYSKYSTFVSVIVAVSISINGLFKFKDKWLLYRSSAEYLNSLLYKYQAESSCKDFDEDKEFKRLKDDVESFLSKSNNEWRGLIETEKDDKKDDK